jgi:hypothetical protein
MLSAAVACEVRLYDVSAAVEILHDGLVWPTSSRWLGCLQRETGRG